MRPADVTAENAAIVKNRLYPRRSKLSKPKFELNDKVRLAKPHTTFEKGYKPRWTKETFKISNVRSTDPPVYEVMDDNGEIILGTFYEAEMQKVEMLTENEPEM
jgi:hypothetical protein